MFKSLKAWMNLPVLIKTYESRNGTGAKQFSDENLDLCYAEGKVIVVKNSLGKEVVSNKQLYFDGTTNVTELDNIVFENSEVEIAAIGYFYRNGVTDLKVVYL